MAKKVEIRGFPSFIPVYFIQPVQFLQSFFSKSMQVTSHETLLYCSLNLQRIL